MNGGKGWAAAWVATIAAGFGFLNVAVASGFSTGDFVYYVAQSPVIDGSDREWSCVPSVFGGVMGQMETSCSGGVRYAWNNDGLYAQVRVVDQLHIADNVRGDCFHIYIDLRDLAVRGRSEYEPGLFHLIISPSLSGTTAGVRSVGRGTVLTGERVSSIRAAWKRSEGGSTVEVAIPWQILGVHPRVGYKLNIGFSVFDTDDIDALSRPAFGIATSYAADQKDADPGLFDELVLTDREPFDSSAIDCVEILRNGRPALRVSATNMSGAKSALKRVRVNSKTHSWKAEVDLVWHTSFAGWFSVASGYIALDGIPDFGDKVEIWGVYETGEQRLLGTFMADLRSFVEFRG